MVTLFTRLFLKDLKSINDDDLKNQVSDAIISIENSETLFDLSNVKKMKGHSDAYRMRIGKYRLGFFYDGQNVKLARFVKSEKIYNLFP